MDYSSSSIYSQKMLHSIYYSSTLALPIPKNYQKECGLNHDTIKVHFTSLSIELLTYQLLASLWKSTKIGQKQGIMSNKNLYNANNAYISDIYDVYLYFYWSLTLLVKTLTPL